MCGYARIYHAEGVLNTDWGDCGHINQPDFSLPGMSYGAVFSWGDDTDSFEELNEQISRLAYGDRSGKFVSYMAKTAECSIFDCFTMRRSARFTDSVRTLSKIIFR